MIDFTKICVGDIVTIHIPSTARNNEVNELAIVEATDAQTRQTIIRPLKQADSINIYWDEDTAFQIRDLPMIPQIRKTLFQFYQTQPLAGLPTKEDLYVLSMTQNDITFNVIIKQENTHWVLAEIDSCAHFGVRFHPIGKSFRELQHVIREVYGIEISETVIDKLTKSHDEISQALLS